MVGEEGGILTPSSLLLMISSMVELVGRMKELVLLPYMRGLVAWSPADRTEYSVGTLGGTYVTLLKNALAEWISICDLNECAVLTSWLRRRGCPS